MMQNNAIISPGKKGKQNTSISRFNRIWLSRIWWKETLASYLKKKKVKLKEN